MIKYGRRKEAKARLKELEEMSKGNNLFPPLAPIGPYDQRQDEKRTDVLVFTSDVLGEDVEATGPVQMKLYAASSAADTDFTAKLVDVYPDGYAQNIVDGIIRARYFDS